MPTLDRSFLERREDPPMVAGGPQPVPGIGWGFLPEEPEGLAESLQATGCRNLG